MPGNRLDSLPFEEPCTIASRACLGVAVGYCCRYSATTPPVNELARDVPVRLAVAVSLVDHAETIW